MKPSEITSSNSRWQNREERPNRTTNTGNIAKTTKRPASDGIRSMPSM